MRWKTSLTLSAAALLAASCAATDPGDFCDVAEPIHYGSAASADWNAEHDPAHADDVAAHNLMGEARCGWRF